MIIVMKKDADERQLHNITERAKAFGLKCHKVEGDENITMSVLGATEKVKLEEFMDLPGVENVIRISKPYKLASREAKNGPVEIPISGQSIGKGNFLVMAGPCSVENEEQVMEIAKAVKEAGATVLRGGAFKPRSSPYAFQGLGEDGLKILSMAREELGLPFVTEALDLASLDLLLKYDADIIQIGARNMQNYALLKELGKLKTPIMLKRGMTATIDEWLMSAEYIMSGGNERVILCERGIRSFDDKYARNTLDLNVVPILKNLSHLPIVVDPSHGTGHRYLVPSLAKAGMAVGADGLIIEVHNQPEKALSDGPQSLYPVGFSQLMEGLQDLSVSLGTRIVTLQTKKEEVA